ncbi:Uncharacterised protein [Mycobacteroides abscessus subsp. abscessus]|nr:Uncharacterised protein [Mycobacteroides abscessus subsp. abscessus]SKU17795.1 Uncharacterised protein [Mycobacteroides abscessus subsp. abscessus]
MLNQVSPFLKASRTSFFSEAVGSVYPSNGARSVTLLSSSPDSPGPTLVRKPLSLRTGSPLSTSYLTYAMGIGQMPTVRSILSALTNAVFDSLAE